MTAKRDRVLHLFFLVSFVSISVVAVAVFCLRERPDNVVGYLQIPLVAVLAPPVVFFPLAVIGLLARGFGQHVLGVGQERNIFAWDMPPTSKLFVEFFLGGVVLVLLSLALWLALWLVGNVLLGG